MSGRHGMPFGSEPEAGGGVRFRLWAPSARLVQLLVDGRCIPMTQDTPGWWAASVPAAAPGSRYQFDIDGRLQVPDPASRFNPDDVHAPSQVIDPCAGEVNERSWRGRPWEDAVVYELHAGAFDASGTFQGVAEHLDHLVELGVTALELMPVADFSGRRNWGYDGVLPFAPDSCYGRPEDLKRLIAQAHRRGLMVLLDVVYNHFGPDGNYIGSYTEPYFNPTHQTPWGAAINYDGPGSRTVRDFFIHNALYWLEEFGLDGLRLDAVHAIVDTSQPHFVEELAAAVRAGPGQRRHVHLILENDHNEARYLARDAQGTPIGATAQWNDDFHHAMHVLLTGESDGYYADYTDDPIGHLGRCLAEGFAYQGQPSPYRGGSERGESSIQLPPGAFVSFLQNHDQVGNRAFGERLVQLTEPDALRAAVEILLLAPSPPLLFMGEEFGATQPFLYFCDFPGPLGAAVTAGRRAEFARFARFTSTAARSDIPDPNARSTFEASVLDWKCLTQPAHRRWLDRYRTLLALRHMWIVPRLAGTPGHSARFDRLGERALSVRWSLGDGSRLTLLANLGPRMESIDGAAGPTFYQSDHLSASDLHNGHLAPWSVAWSLDANAVQP